MVVLELIEQIATICGMFALVGMAILITIEIHDHKTLHRISKYSGNPSVGAINNTIFGTKINKKEKFIITLKNFGEFPAEKVILHFTAQNKILTKETLHSFKENELDIGSLLPNMEKSYWFYMDSDEMENARNNNEQIYAHLIISYESTEHNFLYGIIYKYDSHKNCFVENEIWEETQ